MRILLIALVMLGGSALYAMPQDSIGVRYVNGQKCIVHEVEKKQTLYAISKKYNVKVDDIIKWNSLPNDKIKKGQHLYIMVKTANDKPKEKEEKATYHVVQSGEGLWSISKKYDVTINDIKEWNDLEGDAINVGQKLRVVPPEEVKKEKEKNRESKFHKVEAGETLYSIARTYDMSVEELKNLNSLESNELNIGQLLIVKQEKGKKPVEKQETLPVNSFSKIKEEGIATLVDRAEYNDTKFSYCLHKSAPVGTIIKIMNEATGEYMYAKVMGSLPNDSASVIKVNQTVMKKIGGVNDSFNVKITYIL